jgi:NSS family neurotransmitter:Na+ symporter
MISGAFVAAAVMRFGPERFIREVISVTDNDWQVGPIWERLIKYAIPLQATILLVWWLYLSASTYAPETWYNPFEPYSVMTCLVQWGVAMTLFVVLNKWIVRRNVEIG